MSDSAHVVVIGGGIAGASTTYALASHHRTSTVVLVEAEDHLAGHTTGRSAAQLIENYGTPITRALTKASLDYFTDPPPGLVDHPLLTPRGMLTVAEAGQEAELAKARDEGAAINPDITEISVAAAARLFPPLRTERVIAALHEPDSCDIDVAGLHQSFIRGARRAGATIELSRRVVGLSPDRSGWQVTTTGGQIRADVVVNAAGAWGDHIAELAGLAPIGLQPLRRTAFMVAGDYPGADAWPLVADVQHQWYLKPDGAHLLCSPADETPSEPCDAKPEEIDVARAIESINNATTLAIRSVRSSWAGLRTFTPDRTMAIGRDPDHEGFLWCVGQGGTGIQTAPAAGQLAADLALDGRPGPSFGLGLDLDGLAPGRFRH